MSDASCQIHRAAGRFGTQSAGVLLGVLALLNLLNYVDRYLLSSFANEVIADLHMTYFEFSILSGVLFSAFYAITSVFIGYVADLWKRLRVIALGSALWSMLTSLTGLSTTFTQFALARTFISIGESSLTPASVSALNDTFGSRRLSLVTSVFYIGFPIGTGLSLVLAGVLGPSFGWRGTFVLLGLVGLPLSLLVALLPEPARATRPRGQLSIGTVILGAPRVLVHAFHEVPALGYLALASIFMQFSLGGMALEQVWLVRERGYGVREAQLLFGALYIASASVALLGGGLLADWMRGRHVNGRFHAVLVSTIFVLPSIAFRIVPPHTAAFYLLAIGANMFASLTIGPFYALIQDLSPSESRATVFGLVLLVTTLFGYSLGNACFGMASTLLLDAGYADPLSACLATFNAVGLLSIPMILKAINVSNRATIEVPA